MLPVKTPVYASSTLCMRSACGMHAHSNRLFLPFERTLIYYFRESLQGAVILERPAHP